MVKATLHITIRTWYLILLLILSSCSNLEKQPRFDSENGYRAEKLASLKKHYGKILSSFLAGKKKISIPNKYVVYFDSLLGESVDFFGRVYLIDQVNSFYFISPQGDLIISKSFFEVYFQNEQLLQSFLIENYIRVKNNLYSRRINYVNGLVSYEDLSKIMLLSLGDKDFLNYLSAEKLIQLGKSPMSYLNYIQQRNKDSSLVANVLNGRLFGLEEERHLKTYLLEKHKRVFVDQASLDSSSKLFYSFKKLIKKEIGYE